MNFVITMLAVLSAGSTLAQQPPYPVQYFYLKPNNVASLAPQSPQTRFMSSETLASPPSTSGVEDHDEEEEEVEASQFHSQDGDGRFAFGYAMPDQVRIESRNIDGSVRGSYSYLDPSGKTIKVQYWDDGTGFHSAGNNLPTEIPQPVQDTPEVKAARMEHFRLYQQALEIAAATKQNTLDRTQNFESDDPEEGVVVESDSHTPVDEKGIELTRYPKLQIPQNLFDPAQIHDAKLEAVIVENPEILGPSFDGNSVRSGKSSENFRVISSNIQQKSENFVPSVRKGFSYSFSYPVPPQTPSNPMYEGGLYGYPYTKTGKNQEKSSEYTFESTPNNMIPLTFTYPVPIFPEMKNIYDRSAMQSGHFLPSVVQNPYMHDLGKQPGHVQPSARKGFSYSFSYPIPAKIERYAARSRTARSLDGKTSPVTQTKKTEDLQTASTQNQPISHTNPVSLYVEVKPILEYQPGSQHGFATDDSALRHLFAKTGAFSSQGHSEKAVSAGSIPIAAVHDAQAAPHQLGSFKNHQNAPVYYGNLRPDYGEGDAGRREVVGSGLTKIPPYSVSERAAYFGAIPVAAVHDVQVAPYQRDSIRNHQTLPLYIEHPSI